MDESIYGSKTAITYLLDRVLASHTQSAFGLFDEIDLQLARQ
jgi:hypothetical protein